MVTLGLPPQVPAFGLTQADSMRQDYQLHRSNIAPPEMILAQAILPANDGTGTQVTSQGDRLDISGGSRSADGANLFHSFTRFGLDANQIANFQANPELQNILGRVTGGDASLINGLIQISGGSANLYLINPAGILFGPNAQLNLPASFTATTATGAGFGNQLFQSLGNNNYAQLAGNPDNWVWRGAQAGSIANVGNLTVGQGQSLNLLAGTIVSTGKLTAPEGRITIATVPGTSRLRLTPTGNLLSLEILPAASSPLFSALPLPQLITGGNLNDANGVAVRADGSVRLTGSNAAVNPGDAALAVVKTGSALFQVDRNLLLSNLSSPNDPIVRASGDVTLGNYQGASLHIFAGGNVAITGNVQITGADTTGNGLVENVTLSDGTVVAIDGNNRPTLDIRAGTTRFNPTGISGSGVSLTSSATATGSNITIADVTIDSNNGQILLTNRFAPNPNLAAGAISVGNITTGAGNVVQGGNVTIDSRGPITAGDINTASVFSGGNVRLVAGSNLLFSTINAQSIGPNAVGGNVNLFANGTIQGVGGNASTPTINTQAFSTATVFAGIAIPGAITIAHNGGPNNQPFIVGNSSINGTAGTITTGVGTVPTVTAFANPSANPAPNINIAFNNTAPTIATPSRSFVTGINQPLQITFADLQALVQDADGDNTTLQIASIGPGSLTRNGIVITPGTTIISGDVLSYIPPSNASAVGINAFSIRASDGIATSRSTVIPVNIRPPVNLIPETYPIRSLPTVSEVRLDRNSIPIGTYLPTTTQLNDLTILPKILPHGLLLVDLGSFDCGRTQCTVKSGSYNPGQSGPNFGLTGFDSSHLWISGLGLTTPNVPGTTTLPSIYYPPSGQPNPPDLNAVSPVANPPGQPNPPGPIAVNPDPSGQPGNLPSPGLPNLPVNPSGNPPLPNCPSQIGDIKKQKVANRVKSVYQQLRKCYEQQLSIAEQSKQKTLQTYALSNLATMAYVLGDYLQAIEYHQKQVKIAKSENNSVGIGMGLAGIGAAHGALGDYDKAIQYYERALTLLPENLAPQWRALVLRNIGNASVIENQISTAIEYQRQSLVISRKIGDRYGEAQAYGNLGNAYADNADFAKAIESHQQSLKIAQEIGDRLQEAQALLGLGTTYTYQRNFATAVGYHQQSLVLMRELQARLGEGVTLTNLGDTFFRLQRFAESESTLKDGITVWESLRAGLGNNDAFKVSIFETQLSTYRNLQEALIAQNKPAPALEVAERSRARAFIELVARHRNPTATPIVSPPTIEQIRQIAIAQKATIVQYSIIRDQFVETTHGGSVQFTSKPKELALFIWVVQPTGKVSFRRVELNPANPDDSLTKLVIASRNSISTRSGRATQITQANNITLTPGDFVRRKGEPLSWKPYQVVSVNSADRTVTLSHPEIKLTKPVPIAELDLAEFQAEQFQQFQQLHQKLIAPIADLLPTNPNDTVVFVPQEALFLTPFAALQNPKGEFLIDQHTIVTVPAIQLLGINPARSRLGQAQTALVIGNPSPMPADYAPLPGAETEAKSIAQLLNVRPLIGQFATESAVKSQIAQASVIHLATHGSFDAENPLQGAIALAPVGQEDGLLTAEEVLKLSLRADLVVLSACDTGRGKITGDGVLGLSRSWIAAGAPSLVVSLWEVDDKSTSALMLDFYKFLQQQPDKAIALRQAMLKTKQQYPSPRDWAAFMLIGQPHVDF